MKLRPVDWQHIRIGSLYTARVDGKVEVVKLLGKANGAYIVETLRDNKQARVLTLHYVAAIGNA